MRYAGKAIVILSLLSTAVMGGQLPSDTDGARLTLSAAVQEALLHNPRLQAARYRLEAAKSRINIFRNVPDPMLEYEYDKITPSVGMAGGKVAPMKMLGISQEIPFPTKIWLRRESALREASAAHDEYEETERTVVQEVKEAYARLFLNRQKIAFTNDFLGTMRQYVDLASKRYSTNRGGQQDVFRAQVEYSKFTNELILEQKEARIAEAMLASALGRRGDEAIVLADPDQLSALTISEQEAVELAKKSRPELKSVREMLGRAQVESSLSKQEFLPDITIGYKREARNGDLTANGLGRGEWAGTIGVSVPLWFWGKQASQIREARANLEAARADYQAAESSAVYDARSAFAKYEAAFNQAQTFETAIVPQATSAVTTASRAYETGTLAFSELLEALRTLREMQIEYLEAQADVQMAYAELERKVGSGFDKGEPVK